ncbi:MAG: ChbG/HpnK family deacetylase [Proteobacteria bacterium]|nr:ChbG/HpnK family deacetylase [Pseudomonadota bacterium]
MDHIFVCADDYAIAPGVSRAIRRLAAAGSIDATSCMATSRFWSEEGAALRALAAPVEVGLHLTLTGEGRSTLGALAMQAFAGRIDRTAIAAELDRQLDRFERVWGRPPDFIDGHQHVHQFPTVRAAVLALWERRLDRARTWLRVTDGDIVAILRIGAAPAKALAIAALGRAMRHSARKQAIRTNDAFAGAYDFSSPVAYPELFARMTARPHGRTLVMCHPGEIDDELRAADPLVDMRAVELAYFESSAYAALRAK